METSIGSGPIWRQSGIAHVCHDYYDLNSRLKTKVIILDFALDLWGICHAAETKWGCWISRRGTTFINFHPDCQNPARFSSFYLVCHHQPWAKWILGIISWQLEQEGGENDDDSNTRLYHRLTSQSVK